jgi:ABC-2 type transport system permease protein
MSRSLLADYRDSLRFPAFWTYATWLEIISRYRRSRLGILWALVPAALYTFGIGFFFATLQGYAVLEFVPHLGLGYLVFRLITSTLNDATTACAANSSYILDGRVRLTDYVLKVMARALFYFAVGVPVIVVALALSPSFKLIGLLTFLPSILVVLLNVAWMGVLVAVVGARLPDVSQFIGSALMFGFLFTPIIWRAELVPADTLRGSIARANPLFHMVEVVRAPLLGEPLEILTFIYLAVFLVVGWATAAIVYRRYAKFVPIWI